MAFEKLSMKRYSNRFFIYLFFSTGESGIGEKNLAPVPAVGAIAAARLPRR